MSSEIAVQQESAMEAPQQMLARALDAAIKQGNGMEVVKAILEQQRWMIQHEEEQVFNDALQRIQSQLKVIVKDSSIPGKGKFASSKAIDKAIRDLCRNEKINLSFDTEDSGAPDLLRFVCDASLGAYRKRYTLPLPVDGTGAKGGGVMNKTDATLAAVTKGKRYLKNMIFDLRIEDEDYEVGSEAMPQMEEGAVADWIAGIEGSSLAERGKALAQANDAILAFGDRSALIDLFRAALACAPTKVVVNADWRWMGAQIDAYAPRNLIQSEKDAIGRAREKRLGEVN
jgi:hypothetical protein